MFIEGIWSLCLKCTEMQMPIDHNSADSTRFTLRQGQLLLMADFGDFFSRFTPYSKPQISMNLIMQSVLHIGLLVSGIYNSTLHQAVPQRMA